ncbi:hypothetical protein C482_15031 [Natrialba chahannaoensis JCM 10990]|uniref:DUF8118 domain-containing protein n=2 Tax=Natrialba chahannaoensis TaxID=68911 RepID=M0ADS3_9EURY|nr:hypothetical protein C482_15031 [Natrialba chahannaoensis JCM 10990]
MEISAGLQTSGTTDESTNERRIEGPIPKFNKYGNATGYDYFRRIGCGAEAMRRLNLRDGGCHCGKEAPR